MVSIDSLRPYFEATRAMPEQKSDSGDGNSRKRELTPQVSAECRDFEQLLTDITKAFNNTAHIQFSNVMNDSLGRIARFLKCERSAVFLFGPDRNRLQVTYGWADEGIPPVQVGRYIESDLPWYASHVRSGHLLKLDTVVELPPEAACERQLLLDQGVKSHLSVPLIANGNSIGTVTFASFRFMQCWVPELIVRFRLAAEIFTLALRQYESNCSRALPKTEGAKREPIVVRTDGEQLHRLALNLMEAEDRERKRLAAILHEDIMQTLAVAGFMTDLSQSSQLDVNYRIPEVNRLIRSTIRGLRAVVLDLQPLMLGSDDFVAALRRLGEHVSRLHDMSVHIDLGAGETPAAEHQNRLFLDAVRHLLQNAAVHGRASIVTVELRRIDPSAFRLTVTDNGSGFDTEGLEQIPCKSFGLFALREKAHLLGGWLEITSSPHQGTRVTMTLPQNPG